MFSFFVINLLTECLSEIGAYYPALTLLRFIYIIRSILGIKIWREILEAEQEDKIISERTLMTTDGPDKCYILLVYYIVDIYAIQLMTYYIARNNKKIDKIKLMIDFIRDYSAFN